MQRLRFKSAIPLAIFIIAFGAYFVGAGNLNPPAGPIGPSMKTLSEVEPRELISALPFTITQGGSYYLTGNLTGVSGQNGISINADNVTLDLRGFTLLGVAGSGSGISIQTGRTAITIQNGKVRGWAADGIDASNGSRVVIEHVSSGQNGANGIHLGASSSVSACQAWQNTGAGFQINGNQGYADGNISLDNARGYQVTGLFNIIVRNVAQGNPIADYDIVASNNFGLILNSPGANFTSSAAWANFGGCGPGLSICSGNCVNLQTDPANCGTCGNVCSVVNGTAACVAGSCTVGSCNSGFGNCDGQYATGCETSVNNNVNNCGNCGVVCPVRPNSAPTCVGGNCGITCSGAFKDCDGNLTNGCEVNTNTDVNNCGTCGHVCSVANGTPICNAGVCGVASCNTGWGNCNGNPADGCEAHLTVDTSNCGTCGHVCSVANGTPVCTASVCGVGSCNSGFANCNGVASDGCEVNTNTNANNCGSCGNVCPAGHPCVGGVCQ